MLSWANVAVTGVQDYLVMTKIIMIYTHRPTYSKITYSSTCDNVICISPVWSYDNSIKNDSHDCENET